MTDELLPCPFCGVVPDIANTEEDYTDFGYIGCLNENCHIMADVTARNYTVAIERWNTRPLEDELRAELEKCKSEIVRLETMVEILKDDLAMLEREADDMDAELEALRAREAARGETPR